MKKQTVLKFVAPLMIGSLVLSPLSPSISAHASENVTSSGQVENEASHLLNKINAEKLQAKAKQMNLYDSEGNLTITDAQMVTLMRSQNLPIPEELKQAAMQRKNGVT